MKKKMKLKLKFPKFLLLTVILFLSGCYWNTPVLDLLSPPKLTSEQTEIFTALTNSKGSALTLKYPKTGDFLSAFVLHPDVDDRVMVFYELTGSAAFTEPTVWLTFLEKKDNQWVCTNDITFFATDIERVDFSHLGDSDRENIIISYSIVNQPYKSLCVISSGEKVYDRDFCVFYEIGDFDNSGRNVLLSINRSGGDVNLSSVDFAGWTCAINSTGEFETISTVSANPNAVEYVNSVHSTELYLEYSQADGSFNTGIIIFDDDGRPRNIVYSRNQSQREENLRLLEKRPNQFTAHAYARDIDGSGTINPAGNQRFPGYAAAATGDVVRAAIWYEVVVGEYADTFEQLYYTYLSVNDDFVFFFPDDWIGEVTVTVVNDPSANVTNQVDFWAFDSEIHSSYEDATTILMTVITVPAGEPLCGVYRRDRAEFTRFGVGANPQYDYYVRIYNSAIPMSEVREALKFL
jgi:hypothetical protein